MKLSKITRTDWGPFMRRAAGAVAVAAVAAYVAGEAFGQWLHELNDALATFHRSVLAPRRGPGTSCRVQLLAMASIATACGPEWLARAAVDAPVRTLQQLTGCRAKRGRAYYVARMVAS